MTVPCVFLPFSPTLCLENFIISEVLFSSLKIKEKIKLELIKLVISSRLLKKKHYIVLRYWPVNARLKLDVSSSSEYRNISRLYFYIIYDILCIILNI